MTENIIEQVNTPLEPKKKGVFPRLSLKKTLELSKAIYAVGQGEPVRRLKVFDSMSKSPNSGPSRTLVTVSSMYGLTSGGYKAEYLNLTDLGLKIVRNEETNLIYEILFKNDIFAKFIEYWKDKTLPDDDIASDWIKRTFALGQNDAKSFYEVIRENIRDYNLTEVLSGKQVVVSKEIAMRTNEPTIVSSVSNGPKTYSNDEATSTLLDTSIELDDKNSIQASEIDLENGGKARIVISSKNEITKIDVKKMKTLIDVYSNFVDQ